MSDSEPSEVDEIREQKKAELAASANTPEEPIHVDGEDHFEETVEEQPIVLFDFYADWCGPCEMLEPIVESVAAETNAAVGKVDIDANQELAQRFGVRSIPALLLFVDGEQVEQLVGLQEEDTLVDLIEEHS
jgi:thioredoxin 1